MDHALCQSQGQTIQAGFLKAIIDEPGNISHRLIYADWLEEFDGDRAEFIRLQCYQQGRRRQKELIKLHPEWLPNRVNGIFHRGFVDTIRTSQRLWLKCGKEAIARFPTVKKVVLNRKFPTLYHAVSSPSPWLRTYEWVRTVSTGDSAREINFELFDLLKDVQYSHETIKRYTSEANARKSLSDACIAYGLPK